MVCVNDRQACTIPRWKSWYCCWYQWIRPNLKPKIKCGLGMSIFNRNHLYWTSIIIVKWWMRLLYRFQSCLFKIYEGTSQCISICVTNEMNELMSLIAHKAYNYYVCINEYWIIHITVLPGCWGCSCILIQRLEYFSLFQGHRDPVLMSDLVDVTLWVVSRTSVWLHVSSHYTSSSHVELPWLSYRMSYLSSVPPQL